MKEKIKKKLFLIREIVVSKNVNKRLLFYIVFNDMNKQISVKLTTLLFLKNWHCIVQFLFNIWTNLIFNEGKFISLMENSLKCKCNANNDFAEFRFFVDVSSILSLPLKLCSFQNAHLLQQRRLFIAMFHEYFSVQKM